MVNTRSARLFRGAAALSLLLGGVFASSAPAQAADVRADTAAGTRVGVQATCLTQWFARDFELGHGVSGSNPIRSGPYAECPLVTSVGNSRTLIYDCYVINDYNNRWTHVRVSQSTIQGWVFNDHLSGGGANSRC